MKAYLKKKQKKIGHVVYSFMILGMQVIYNLWNFRRPLVTRNLENAAIFNIQKIRFGNPVSLVGHVW